MNTGRAVSFKRVLPFLGSSQFEPGCLDLACDLELRTKIEPRHKAADLCDSFEGALLLCYCPVQVRLQLTQSLRVQACKEPHRVLAFPASKWILQPEE
jgi:hypothetical protein